MKKLIVALLLTCAFQGPAIGAFWNTSESDYYSVSLSAQQLATHESVYGFTVAVMGGTIVDMRVPNEWNMSIDNSEGERSSLRAHTVHGADALGSDSFDYFHDFLVVAKLKEPQFVQFEIKVVLEIRDDGSDYERSVGIPLNKITLTRRSWP